MAMCVILVSFQRGRERNQRNKPETGTNGNGAKLENYIAINLVRIAHG